MKRVATATLCLAFALLTFFQFPGHTWLQQDTQIYTPILEHLRDSSVLRNEILVEQPHVAYTVYDEVALGLRRVTGLGFREILQAQQIVTRALGFWAILLLAEAMGVGFGAAVAVAAILSLGVVVAGPTVLTVEYEPTPRAFAFPLVLLAIGLGSRGRYLAAGIAAGVAALYHPPTTLPFWAGWAVLCLWDRKERASRLIAFVPLGVAAVLIRFTSLGQRETQTLFTLITPSMEMLQRLRASYVYVSTWTWATILHHVVLFAIVVAAFARIGKSMGRDLRLFLVALPGVGLLTMPVSWLLLEHWKWGAMPQLQPMRTLLFVTIAMQLLCAVAALKAVSRVEAAVWFALAFLLPLQASITGPYAWKRVAIAVGLGAAAAVSGRFTWVVAVAAFWVIPVVGGVVNYPQQHTPELAEVTQWARSSTPKDAVFLFADTPRGLDAGLFRSEALRAIYVDWKGGGQVNYLTGFGEQWWFRWQQTLARKFSGVDLGRYEGLGIGYVVVRREHAVAGRAAVFENAKYVVYGLR